MEGGVAVAAAASSVQCTAGFLHAYGVNVAANEDAGSVVRGARTHASRAEPINGRGSHHWLRSNFTPLPASLLSTVQLYILNQMMHVLYYIA